MDLRDKIANVLIEQGFEGLEEAYPMADAILGIEEIREALKLRFLVKSGAEVNAGTKA